MGKRRRKKKRRRNREKERKGCAMRRNVLLVTALVFALLTFAACGMPNGKEAGGTEGDRESSVEEAMAGENEGNTAEEEAAAGKNEGNAAEEEAAAEEIRENAAQEGEATENTTESVAKEGNGGEGARKTAEAGGNVYVRIDESKQEYKAEDGTVLLTITNKWPVVTISDNEQAAAAINEAVLAYIPGDEDKMQEWAAEDYKTWGKDNWFGYETDLEFIPERADEEVISFSTIVYFDMGGAHPNASFSGVNFSTKTGKRLTLDDITMEKEAAVSAIQGFLLEETKKEEYTDMFYDDYEDKIGDALTEDTWYLGKDGLHIIVNEYIIAPHAAGSFDFVIPYEEADFLKDEFKM